MQLSSPAQTELYGALVDLDEAGAWRVMEEQRERAGLEGLVGELVLPVAFRPEWAAGDFGPIGLGVHSRAEGRDIAVPPRVVR